MTYYEPQQPTNTKKGIKLKSPKHYESARKKDLETTLRQPLVMVDSSIQVKKEESMIQKARNGEISWKEYENYLSKKRDKNKPKSMRQKYTDGEITKSEYANYNAHKKGFKDNNESERIRTHKLGIYKSQSENKECPLFLGVYVAERILSKIFENVKRMPQNFTGYDFICGRGFKIDVKSRCIYKKSNCWRFKIDKNKVADYFLLLAFDSREDLNPLHVWLIKGTEMVGVNGNKECLNNKWSLQIGNTIRSLDEYKKYDQTDKLEKIIECCNNLKFQREDVI